MSQLKTQTNSKRYGRSKYTLPLSDRGHVQAYGLEKKGSVGNYLLPDNTYEVGLILFR